MKGILEQIEEGKKPFESISYKELGERLKDILTATPKQPELVIFTGYGGMISFDLSMGGIDAAFRYVNIFC